MPVNAIVTPFVKKINIVKVITDVTIAIISIGKVTLISIKILAKIRVEICIIRVEIRVIRQTKETELAGGIINRGEQANHLILDNKLITVGFLIVITTILKITDHYD